MRKSSSEGYYLAAEVLEDHHAEGDRLALMRALYFCMKGEVAPPPWARELFCSAFAKVADAEVGSWDAAFGKPYPKNAKLVGLQSAQRRYEVDSCLERLRQKRARGEIRDDLHRLAGEELGMSRTRVVELEKMVRDEIAELLAEVKKLKPGGWVQLSSPLRLPGTS